MSIRPDPLTLAGQEGELISLRIPVEPKLLEDLLEILAELPFPINPQILSHPTAVEFPGYQAWVDDISRALERNGFSAPQTRAMIHQLRG